MLLGTAVKIKKVHKMDFYNHLNLRILLGNRAQVPLIKIVLLGTANINEI